jgi:hypothetical protein
VNFDAGLTQAEFDLSVFNGVEVTVAHLHCERPGRNGPVVIFLFGPADPPLDMDGELAGGHSDHWLSPGGRGPDGLPCAYREAYQQYRLPGFRDAGRVDLRHRAYRRQLRR